MFRKNQVLSRGMTLDQCPDSWGTISDNLVSSGFESTSCLLSIASLTVSFPGDSEDKASACNAGRPGFDPWIEKIPWRRRWQPTRVLLPGKSHRWRSLVGYSPWSHKESDTMVSYFTSLREILLLLLSNTTAAENSKYGPISSQINMNTYTKGLFNSFI